ncbi:TetR/AcrR family transcriptional regulator [Hoyosella altamirensis]|uniref:AcrR family transcriptional regulator n=1 Tax=Hoyosella altamirensis TaxID=616997 RepID=A0A839RJN0_9ACTN|nr:TetR/AcrR family transcriptional regulator [Hoyosella altamirensis]MBB3036384.1 AcrR family transcriptional regulator [Hoyosella altamirensis]
MGHAGNTNVWESGESVDRRTQLADIVTQIAAERGLDHVSVREVASAAGVSIGAVQHHFRSKDALLLAAFQRYADTLGDRIRAMDQSGKPRDVVRKLLLELLPLDGPRSTETRMFIAFAARAIVTPELAHVYHEGLGQLRTVVTHLVELAQQSGDAVTHVSADTLARTLLAVADGATLQTVTSPDEGAVTHAVAEIDAALGFVFPGY